MLMKETNPRLAEETVAIRTRLERSRSHRPLNAPLYQTSQWEAESLGSLAELFAQDPNRGFYTRFGHPTLRLAEEKLAELGIDIGPGTGVSSGGAAAPSDD
jgi:O-acetylhomoserine/O-acetylserine sulfhydrylase-like pyridoxal-dependent enzyme